jgi:hypothetical protein
LLRYALFEPISVAAKVTFLALVPCVVTLPKEQRQVWLLLASVGLSQKGLLYNILRLL